MNNNITAQNWYERAYDKHYNKKDFKEAYAEYLLVAKCFDGTSWANYALQQMDNIRNSSVFSSEFDAYANQTTNKYYNMDQMMEDVMIRVSEAIDAFPSDKIIKCDMAVFSKDEENLYYCGFGQITEKIDTIMRSLPVASQMDVSRNLLDSIIATEPSLIIPIHNILYFQERGDLSYSTSLSGGGGSSKGVNIGGAIAGKLLFGNTGALIGSRAGTGIHIDEIKSETIEHDNRYVVLRYKDDSKNYYDIPLSFDCFEALNTLIPEKEYSHVQVNSGVNRGVQTEQKVTSSIPVDELRKLKMLLDEGIITQEDFDNKKKQLLGL